MTRERCASIVLVVLLASIVPGIASASHAEAGIVGGFEIDGNFTFDGITVDGVTATRDWENVGGVIRVDDLGDSSDDDRFTQGSKESQPNDWVFTNSKPSGKADLTRAYFANEVTATDAYLWLGFERLETDGQGSAHVNFEVNQSKGTVVNAKGTEIPERTTDDLLVVYDYAGGSNPVTIQLYRWQGLAPNPALFGNWVSVAIPADEAFGDINAAAITRPAGDPFGGGTVGLRRFGEAGLNVTGIFGPNFVGCPGFGSFWVKTRSSGSSFDSALQDFTAPEAIDFSTCAKITVLKEDDQGAPLDGATFTLYQDDNGSIGDEVDTCVTSGGQCTFEDVEPGDYWVLETEAPDGYVGDPTASFVTVGIQDHVTVPHTYVNTKVQYRLTLTPEQDTNLVDTDHVIQVLLERSLDGGNIWEPVAGETVSLELEGEGEIVDIDPAGPDPDTCTTRDDGTCTVTIRSADAGSSTLKASFEKMTATTPVGASGEAGKDWANYRISVQPGSDSNVVDSGHTFVVTLERTTDGETWSGVSGAIIDIDLDGVGEIVTNTCADPGTDANGQCTVTITSSDAGTSTLTASYLAVEGDTSRTFSASAEKVWVDFRISVTPDEDTNPIRISDDDDSPVTHTFTVTLERTEDGETWTGVEGATPTVVLNGVGQIIENTCEDPGTDADGVCTVTITSDTPGTSTLTVTYLAVVGASSKSYSDTGIKHWEDHSLTVTPGSAFNKVGEPHTFTVTLTRDTGSGPEGVAGETINLSLDPGDSDAEITEINGEPASGTEGTCITDADGTCSVVIDATQPGTAVLTATWDGLSGTTEVSRSATAEKIYIAITLAKAACPVDTSPAGGVVEYAIELTVAGAPLTNATVTDDLPGEVRFVSASQLGGVDPETPEAGDSNGTVTWSFDSLAEGSYSATIVVTVDAEAEEGTEVTNVVTLTSDEVSPESAEHTLVVLPGGEADARAFGLQVDLGGSTLIGPTPDSDEASPDETLSIPIPGVGGVTLLHVTESDDSALGVSGATAIATTLDVDLDLGPVHVQASSIVTRSSSTASGFTAGSMSAGSKIQDLRINGETYGDVVQPLTIIINNPLTGESIAEVRVLEHVATGAADGDAQPNGNAEFASGLTVNGIRVTLLGGSLAEVTVAHASSEASAPSGIGCVETPLVEGSAFAVGLQDVFPDLGSIRAGQVDLPSTGGDASSGVVLDLPVAVSGTALTATSGSISIDPETAEAHAEATVEDLDLLGAITATLVQAVADANLEGSEGTTTIADLVIGGTDVCDALGLGSVCTPDPNTVLLIPSGPVLVMLNEQIPTDNGITVNAVHIWVLGQDNPLGLPAGAETIISSATAGAVPASADEPNGDNGENGNGENGNGENGNGENGNGENGNGENGNGENGEEDEEDEEEPDNGGGAAAVSLPPLEPVRLLGL